MVDTNLTTLRTAEGRAGADGIAAMLLDAADRITAAADHWSTNRPTMRHQSDGDIYNANHARAIATVARLTPRVAHWLYTRSLDHAPALLDGRGRLPRNLVAYLSADAWNADQVAAVLARHPVFRVAVLAQDDDSAAEILARVERSATARLCPAAGGKYTTDGRGPAFVTMGDGTRAGLADAQRGERGRGACDACGLCIDGRADVVFHTHGRRLPAAPTCPVAVDLVDRLTRTVA
jgi:hypothetical protein